MNTRNVVKERYRVWVVIHLLVRGLQGRVDHWGLVSKDSLQVTHFLGVIHKGTHLAASVHVMCVIGIRLIHWEVMRGAWMRVVGASTWWQGGLDVMRVRRIEPRWTMMLHGVTLDHLSMVHRMKRRTLHVLAWLSAAVNGSTTILYLGISLIRRWSLNLIGFGKRFIWQLNFSGGLFSYTSYTQTFFFLLHLFLWLKNLRYLLSRVLLPISLEYVLLRLELLLSRHHRVC